MPGRCAECGFDAAAYTGEDARRTLQSFATRWRWTVEGVDPAALVAAGPDGLSAMDHLLRAEGPACAGDVESLAAAVHAGTHHLHATGRAIHHAGAGAPDMAGVVAAVHRSGGGVPKLPVDGASVTAAGLEGDRQATRRHHGRPWQALSMWSAEVIEALAAEGHPIAPGAAGENVTVSGIDWSRLRPGSILRLGDVRCELTAWADPCRQLTACFAGGDVERVSHDRHPGWSRAYAAVLRGGRLRAGDPVIVEGGA